MIKTDVFVGFDKWRIQFEIEYDINLGGVMDQLHAQLWGWA